MLCKHSTQGIKHLQTRFLDNKEKIFFFWGGGEVKQTWKNRICYQCEQTSKFEKPNWQLCDTAWWGLLRSERGIWLLFLCTCWCKEGRCPKLLMKDSFANQCADAGNALQFYSWWRNQGRCLDIAGGPLCPCVVWLEEDKYRQSISDWCLCSKLGFSRLLHKEINDELSKYYMENVYYIGGRLTFPISMGIILPKVTKSNSC